jgi:CheY-like chemotaxis protein
MGAESRIKIAFVEDSPDSAQLFTIFLNEFCDDFEVFYFSNGPEFLQTIQPGLYPIAILDISLPGMDGYELIQRMHSVDPDITAVAFRAHAGDHNHQKAIDAGFHSVVTKPVHELDRFCRKMVDLVDRTAR